MSWVDNPFAPWIPVIVVAILCAAMIGGGDYCCDTFYSEVGTYCPECGTKRARR